jgi:hypothetical protein
MNEDGNMKYARYWGMASALALVAALLSACTSEGRNYADSAVHETLEIEILPNTSKMFVYRLRWPQDARPNAIHLAGRDSDGNGNAHDSGGASLSNLTEKRLTENAGFVAQRMGYCREGFLVIDSSISRYHLWMKGECKDGASEADKQKFGTKQILPVKGLH